MWYLIGWCPPTTPAYALLFAIQNEQAPYEILCCGNIEPVTCYLKLIYSYNYALCLEEEKKREYGFFMLSWSEFLNFFFFLFDAAPALMLQKESSGCYRWNAACIPAVFSGLPWVNWCVIDVINWGVMYRGDVSGILPAAGPVCVCVCVCWGVPVCLQEARATQLEAVASSQQMEI